jgi:hypothetical protein
MEDQIAKALKLAKQLKNAESTRGWYLESCLQQTQSIAKGIRAECSCWMDYLSLPGNGKMIKPRESNRQF